MRAVNLRDPQSTVTLEVQATGATFYKWFHKESEIQGETEAMLTIDNVQPSNAGEYKVQAHNDCDFVESQLTQLAIRHLSNAKFANGKFGFKMDGQAGEVWIFQVSTDLKNWTEAGRVTLDVSGIPVSATGSLAILNGRVVDNGSDPMQTTRMYRILKPQ